MIIPRGKHSITLLHMALGISGARALLPMARNSSLTCPHQSPWFSQGMIFQFCEVRVSAVFSNHRGEGWNRFVLLPNTLFGGSGSAMVRSQVPKSVSAG